MHIFSAHWHHDILRLTAQELLRRYDSTQLPHVLLLMPNRRSCVNMREAFKDIAAGETLLLPRIVPLADAETELLAAFARGQQESLNLLESLPPAMGRWQHRMILAELVRAFEIKRAGLTPSLQHVLALTDDLIAIQEDVAREGLSLSSLDVGSIAFPDMAQHWQINAAFLNILFEEWPYIEKEKGMITRAEREQRVLAAIDTAWRDHAPSYPVWMVGSTGSMPAVRRLMATIAQMPEGTVMLPALDITLHEEVAIGHAQHYLHLSLKAMGASVDEVTLLGDTQPQPRQALWQGLRVESGKGLEVVACAHEEEEAGVIALMVREALETPAKQVAVITPSPALMQRVRLHLRVHNITVTTPQGEPLAHSAAGQCLSHILRCLDEEVGVLSLLDLLHTEGVTCGDDPQQWQSFLRKWRSLCRGIVPPIAASTRIGALASEFSIAQTVQRLVHDMESLAKNSSHTKPLTLAQWVAHLRALIKGLCPQSVTGHEAVDALLEDLTSSSSDMPLITEDIVALVQEALMKPQRSPDLSAHPRVSVLSPMEARLQCFDRVILAGCNEGDWPITYHPNPWLNLGQRALLGLTPPETHVTLAAHDICSLGMAEEVFLTRSAKSEGSPTTPSRFLVKLQTLMEREGAELATRPWRQWWAGLHQVSYAPIMAEAPSPEIPARPSLLKVTSLRHLFSDPYAIYAEYVLGLRQLDAYDQTPDARNFGSLVHSLIEEMLEQNKTAEDSDWLLSRVAHLDTDARLYALWLPRIRNILRFVAAVHSTRRFSAVEMEVEKERNIGPITLKGKIDRLEKQGSNYSIHDYKTGDAPKKGDMEKGLDPQLIAYALMLSEEAGILPEQLVYWALPKARHQGALVPYDFSQHSLEQHIAMLEQAIAAMFAQAYAFYALKDDSPYAGVSRNDEWAA